MGGEKKKTFGEKKVWLKSRDKVGRSNYRTDEHETGCRVKKKLKKKQNTRKRPYYRGSRVGGGRKRNLSYQ